jgi:hypothetical protein
MGEVPGEQDLNKLRAAVFRNGLEMALNLWAFLSAKSRA